MRSRSIASAALAALTSTVLGFALHTETADAQEDKRTGKDNGAGVDLHLFRSAFDSKGFFTTNGADLLPANKISFGLVVDYGYNLLPLNEGHGADQFVKHSFQGTLQFNYGIANWLVLGLSAPVVLAGGNDTVTDVGPTGKTYDVKSQYAQGLSYIALNAKLRIIRPGSGPGIGLAILTQGGVAAVGADNLIAEPKGFIWPEAVLEGRALPDGRLRLALNAGFRAHFGDHTKFEDGADGLPQLKNGIFEYNDLVTGNFAASVRVFKPLDLMAETYATYMVGGESDSKERISAEAIGGFKLFIDGKSYLLVGAGGGYTPGFQTATARATIGFMYEPSVQDRDHDGVPDDEDLCPDVPGLIEFKGCPDPDRDHDGVPDVDDECPTTPGPARNHGCPEIIDGDDDHDGILNSRDKCPHEAGLAQFQGCPDPDRDHDGVPNAEDQCPDEPGPASNHGCPLPPKPEENKWVIVTENSILILDKIQFETGSSKILASSNSILDAVSQTLKEHPEFTLIEVQGHADERGGDAMNLGLTKSRSASVSDALTRRGVAKERLRSQGYGTYCPLDEGHNDAAWEKNRRVEFKIVRSKDGPTGVVLGCAKAEEKGIKPTP